MSLHPESTWTVCLQPKNCIGPLGPYFFSNTPHISTHKILVIQNDLFFMHWVPFNTTLEDSMSTAHPRDHTFILKSYGIFHTG